MKVYQITYKYRIVNFISFRTSLWILSTDQTQQHTAMYKKSYSLCQVFLFTLRQHSVSMWQYISFQVIEHVFIHTVNKGNWNTSSLK